MKILKLLSKKAQKEKIEGFSEFFLRASKKEKEKIIREVAHRANKEQQKIFTKSKLKIKTN